MQRQNLYSAAHQNNPTANLLNSEDILVLCNLGAMVIVDEAT